MLLFFFYHPKQARDYSLPHTPFALHVNLVVVVMARKRIRPKSFSETKIFREPDGSRERKFLQRRASETGSGNKRKAKCERKRETETERERAREMERERERERESSRQGTIHTVHPHVTVEMARQYETKPRQQILSQMEVLGGQFVGHCSHCGLSLCARLRCHNSISTKSS
jgi:hypothetical protein